MATITLDYNSKNIKAQKTLDYILSMGFFKARQRDVVSNEVGFNKETKQAMLDVEKGNLIYCGSYEDYLKATEKYA